MFGITIKSKGVVLAMSLVLVAGCSQSPNPGLELFEAVSKGQTTVVKALLVEGADMKFKDENGVTLLMLAASAGHTAIVNALLAKGADVNAKSKDGVTALMLASNKGHTGIVKALLVKGADVSVKAKNGSTALSAVAPEHSGIVDLLKAAGAKE